MAHAVPANQKWWSGGKSPFNVEYGKLMMWYFLMSDAFTFGAFLISYGSTRMASNGWPDANKVFNSFPFAGHTNLPNFFFTITGFHGFHVFSGVVINIIMLIKAMRGDFDKRGHYLMVEKTGLYWHFVDLVWVFVFLCFYLL